MDRGDVEELKCWIGIVRLPAIRDYWASDERMPRRYHQIRMTLEQIKRCFHIPDPDMEPEDSEPFTWHHKAESLFTQLRYASHRYCMPSSNIYIDEAMVRLQVVLGTL